MTKTGRLPLHDPYGGSPGETLKTQSDFRRICLIRLRVMIHFDFLLLQHRLQERVAVVPSLHVLGHHIPNASRPESESNDRSLSHVATLSRIRVVVALSGELERMGWS